MRTVFLSLLLVSIACEEFDAGSVEATIPSYALREVRPGPLVPEAMRPTILAPFPGTLIPNAIPD
ncbi:MAG: hypothetical protein AAGD14_00440 [Planctomycetota bacterium]